MSYLCTVERSLCHSSIHYSNIHCLSIHLSIITTAQTPQPLKQHHHMKTTTTQALPPLKHHHHHSSITSPWHHHQAGILQHTPVVQFSSRYHVAVLPANAVQVIEGAFNYFTLKHPISQPPSPSKLPPLSTQLSSHITHSPLFFHSSIFPLHNTNSSKARRGPT